MQQISKEEMFLASRVKELTWEHLDKLDDGIVEYRTQGNFTIAMLFLGGTPFIGVTKRMVDDINRPEHAERIAFKRAVETFSENWHPPIG